MQRFRLLFKLLLIVGIIILLLLPQAMLMGLIGERVGWRTTAYESIGQSWPGGQTLAGPIMVLPYSYDQTVTETVKDAQDKEKKVTKTVKTQEYFYLIPKQLEVNSQLTSSIRYRGIYEVPIYSNQIKVKGQFETQALVNFFASLKNKKVQFDQAFLSVLVNDQRGIASTPILNWQANKLAFKPSANLNNAAGMYVNLPDLNKTTNEVLPFEFDLELRGMASMAFALLSENSNLTMQSNWLHPKFTGELLPETREISDKGFKAVWHTSAFSYNVQNSITAAQSGQQAELLNHAVGVELLQPVDVYQQSERSIKYAFLFIVLTFTVLILFELIKKLRIHPVQYTFVGLVLIVFYLLLISLSEHFDFSTAYAIATVASTGLLTLYFSAILKNRKLGLLLGGGLLLLYGLLYMILQTEDNALLMGSLLIFAILAGLMLATRHLDWYDLTHAHLLAKPENSPKNTP
jgi:inner membrane protein